MISIDAWNERLRSYVGVPLQEPRATESVLAPRVSLNGLPLDAVVGRLSILFAEDLAGAEAALPAADLGAIEHALSTILGLPALLSPHPARPRPPAGPITYPLWGEMYYAGTRIGGEFKRFVAVSTNEWNRADNSALLVRTTTQPKRSTLYFPHIQNGRAQAACGDISFFPAAVVQLRNRPPSPLVSLTDMVAIARGLKAVLGL